MCIARTHNQDLLSLDQLSDEPLIPYGSLVTAETPVVVHLRRMLPCCSLSCFVLRLTPECDTVWSQNSP